MSEDQRTAWYAATFTLGTVIGFLVGGLPCFWIGREIESGYRQEAIDRGAAHYNPQTGAWEWTLPVKKEQP